MLLDRRRPHAVREVRTAPPDADACARRAVAAVEARARRATALEAYAVHLASDGTRVVTIEAWRDAEAFRADPDARAPGTGLYRWAATGGREPTPVDDADAGAIVIDVFSVWRPLVRPVSMFNIRNGEAFNRHPGCISTTVLRGIGHGHIATYARWRSVADFAAAFAAATGWGVAGTDDVNRATARMTFGLIRTDYHGYTLVAAEGARDV
jgi:heme-degrading monooxygenase HmoA